MFERILVATDGSRGSKNAVSRAIALAAENRCELVALTVVRRRALDYFDGVDGAAAAADAGALAPAHAALEQVLREARLSAVPVRVEAVVSDRVAEAIVDVSRRWHSDLIVMGRPAIGRWLAGKTGRVLESSGLPTLAVQ